MKKNLIKIKPLGDRVLVKPILADSGKTSLGIIIPDTIDKEKPEQGKIMAVGEGRYEDGKLISIKVKVGQKVIFSKYGYDEVNFDGEEYFILNESNILAVLN